MRLKFTVASISIVIQMAKARKSEETIANIFFILVSAICLNLEHCELDYILKLIMHISAFFFAPVFKD